HPGVASIEAQENSTRQRPDMLKMDRFFGPGMHCGSDRGLRFCRAIRDQPPDARTVGSEYDLRKDITAPQRIVQTLSLTAPQLGIATELGERMNAGPLHGHDLVDQARRAILQELDRTIAVLQPVLECSVEDQRPADTAQQERVRFGEGLGDRLGMSEETREAAPGRSTVRPEVDELEAESATNPIGF